MSKIDVGSVVQIKSGGGPVMTVVEIDILFNEATCKWYNLMWMTETFPVRALKVVEPPAHAPGTDLDAFA